MRGQALSIALVVACGIATYAVTSGSYESLLAARADYYRHQIFPDVFVAAKRAPLALRERLESLPGVGRVTLRLRESVTIRMPARALPVTGTLLSLPPLGAPAVGGLRLRRGRYPTRDDEILLLEAFFDAHDLALGDRLSVVIQGSLRSLKVVGVAISPEFLFAVPLGEVMPDPARFAVLWMEHDGLSRALRMEGAFNEAVFKLQSARDEAPLVARLRSILRAYGGSEPYGRSRHLSESLLSGELTQLKMVARVMPTIFLAVAAFLVSVVLGRIVQLQRSQVGALKALGYGDWSLGVHFLMLVGAIVSLGTIVGVTAGLYLSDGILNIYQEYFQFPELQQRLDPGLLVRAVIISFTTAAAGACWAVRAVVRLPPAKAMQPEPPAVYRRSLADRLQVARLLGQSARMVLREVERNPVRSLLSAAGIAGAVALLVVGRFSFDALDAYRSITFEQAMRQDVTVTFARPQPLSVLHELRHLPGVLRAEGQRTLPSRLVVGARGREVSVVGRLADAQLGQLVDVDGHVHRPPVAGLSISHLLTDLLHVSVGDTVEVHVREGQRRVYHVPVVATVREMYGLSGHMDFYAMHQLLGELPSLSLAHLRIDPTQRSALYAALRRCPQVLGVSEHQRLLERFVEQTESQMNTTTLIMTLFAAALAAGVVYNDARLSLSTRRRDLSSLRVLGFRRGEISALLLGELALHVLVALLPGMWLGSWLVQVMTGTVDPEQYRFPIIISLKTYVFSGLVTVGASAVSALFVQRKLDEMDLTEVLKDRG